MPTVMRSQLTLKICAAKLDAAPPVSTVVDIQKVMLKAHIGSIACA